MSKYYCDCCGKQTNHKVLYEVKKTEHDEYDEEWIEKTYRIIQCCGCDNISFNLEITGSEFFRYGEYGDEDMYSDFISYPVKEGTIKPLESWDIPQNIRNIYRESIMAFNNDCYILATTGLRSTVEAICNDKNVGGNKLKDKIDRLLQNGIITLEEQKRLHEMRFSGNDSAHQTQPLGKAELLLLIDIINNILSNLYVLDKKIKDTFYYRFESENHFFDLLDKGVLQYSSGGSYTLRTLLPEEYKYRKEDIARYETELIGRITAGTYPKLELDGTPAEGQKQKFRVK